MSWKSKSAIAIAAVGGLTVAAGAAIKAATPSFVHDITLTLDFARFNKAYSGLTATDVLEHKARSQPDKVMILFEDQAYTFRDIDNWCNRVARTFIDLGLVKGDRVALMMTNEPAFVWILLGLYKIGVVVTLINHNLRLQSLLHCITVADCIYVIVGADSDLVAAVNEIADQLAAGNRRPFVYADELPLPAAAKFEAIANRVKRSSAAPLPVSQPRAMPTDKACHIFTSGTTGLPKAAIINQERFLLGIGGITIPAGANGNDVFYSPLPLYHGSALIFLMSSIVHGATLVLARKFSTTAFWNDCRRHNVTVIQYIGETCRYLLAAPKNVNDGRHSVRMAFGNGLRLDIWQEFKERFNIERIIEFYAASEGTFAFLNLDNTEGSCGKRTPLLNAISPRKSYGIRYDVDKDAVVRGANGFCILADFGEAALYVSPITNVNPFVGYEDKGGQNEKKILRNVFKKGDAYFNSGDLLMQDKLCNMYFVDRVGDTFRWNGENVSTLEVSNVLSTEPGVQDAIVYGVEVPGHDGRAGMAALCLQDGVSVSDALLASLYARAAAKLPKYAQPLFLRVLEEVPLTSTFKHSKGELKSEGFDPRRVAGGVYFKSPDARTFVKMDDQLFSQVNRGILSTTSNAHLRIQAKL